MKKKATMNRRRFVRTATLGALSLGVFRHVESRLSGAESAVPVGAPVPPDAQVGSLYPLLQTIAEDSTCELSFLHDRFSNIETWKREARSKVFPLLHLPRRGYCPPTEKAGRTDCGDYVLEKIYFHSTPDIRVPACLLLPKGETKRRPAIVALHDHGAFFVWGKEKLIAMEHEHPSLTKHKLQYYAGRSVASELARRGYVVIVIDMFYWGERRMVLAADPPAWRTPAQMTTDDITAFNRRSSTSAPLIATGLFEAGTTWAGLMFLDDIGTVDYLVQRPEVDPERIGCCGLSVGGFRSAWLAGLDSRIKAAVVVGWMCTARDMLQSKLTSIGFWKTVPGLYRCMDLPDIVSMTAPGALMAIHGTQDRLFTNNGVRAAYDKIARVYAKAGVPERFEGVTFDGPHEFNVAMQDKAFAWLDRWLKP